MMVISSPPRELISIFPNKRSSPGFSPGEWLFKYILAIQIYFKPICPCRLDHVHGKNLNPFLLPHLAKAMLLSSLPSTELLSHQKDSS